MGLIKILCALLSSTALSFSNSIHACIDKVAREINVSPTFFTALLKTESGLHPYAIGVSYKGRPIRALYPETKEEAIYLANYLYQKGYYMDIGIGQISIQNLERWGVPIEYAFDPCFNIKLSGIILKECMAIYGRSAKAVDCYNKGRRAKGYTPYVRKVLRNYSRLLSSKIDNY